MQLLKYLPSPSFKFLPMAVVLLLILLVGIANKQYREEHAVLGKTTIQTTLGTKATPTATPSPTNQPVTQQAHHSLTSTPTPTVTLTPTPTQTPAGPLTITFAEPSFLWADYWNTGAYYLHLKGSGFTSQTRVSLVVTSLGEPFPSDMGKTYPVGNVSFTANEFWGTIPQGLYNSYYKAQAYNTDGSFAETGAFLVVSGSTREEGTAPHPEYYEPTAAPTIEPSESPAPTPETSPEI